MVLRQWLSSQYDRFSVEPIIWVTRPDRYFHLSTESWCTGDDEAIFTW